MKKMMVDKWGIVGKIAGFNMTDPPVKGDEFRKRLDDLNLSPENTFIQLENICLEEGLDDLAKAKLGIDCALFSNICVDMKARFSEECATEVIRRIY